MAPRHKHKYRNIFYKAIIQIQTNDWWICMQVWHIFYEMMKLALDVMVSTSLAAIYFVAILSIGDREFREHEIYIKLTVTVELRINIRPFRFLLGLFREEQSSVLKRRSFIFM